MLRTSIVTWSNTHLHGDLWYQHLCLRKQLFVDSMGWDIPHNSKCEWDQYDTANTIYAITHRDNQVTAASRMNPCSFSTPTSSYMIRDASLGRLPGIPPSILPIEDIPTDPQTWEATRFTADPDLPPEQRNEALAANAHALAAIAHQNGIKRLIALMPPAYIRWLSSIGLKTHRLGPTQKDSTGARCCVMAMPLALPLSQSVTITSNAAFAP